MSRENGVPEIPIILQQRSTDEFAPPPDSTRAREALARVRAAGPGDARRTGTGLRRYWAGRRGTAAGLRALNEAFRGEAGGGEEEDYYRVPAEAALEDDAANEALSGDEVVIDVQTHYVANRSSAAWSRPVLDTYRALMPDWWTGLETWEAQSLAEYLRCVYLESETAVAVLTSAPGLSDTRMLWNAEMAGTREMLDRLGAKGRLLNHCVVHPNVAGELETMDREAERNRPAGWKAYTMGHADSVAYEAANGWWLDDDETGLPFLERARRLGGVVCVHKGISALVPTGSPRDIGPAANAFPDLPILVYHSGYEMPTSAAPEEGPFEQATRDVGTNRLVASLADAGVGPGRNVHAELGSTWFCLIRRPDEAAHVLGKLLLAVGEDNVLWGSDSIWYGPTQPAIDAFRAFQIPASLRERHGYPELTPEVKAKILGRNAARVYGIDLEQARDRAANDDLAWVAKALDEFDAQGTPTLEA